MECRDAQFYLRLRHHAADELGPDVDAALEGHLTTCPACAADARTAASFDRALASAMRAVPVPAGLHERLLTQAAAKQGAILRGRLYRAGSLVAAALVLFALGLSVFSVARPKFDTDELVQLNDDQLSTREESTQAWLKEQKLPGQLPRNFDYDLFMFRGFEKVKGKDVPVLLFRSPEGSGFAKVYIVREDGRFDLKDIRDAQGSHVGAEVEVGKDQFRGFTYVFVHTGGANGLKPFLKTQKGPAQPTV